ncbi:MAG TPA: sigma-E factor negative regulatory protein [Burkholderiales bacterium]|nr:sigma-E factor negative regulatory protein [Burkholderiales bacterium]
MKQDLSAFMDGELDPDAAKAVLAELKRNSELRGAWIDYHLIRDVLGQSGMASHDISERFKERLAGEPVVFSPRKRIVINTKIAALSAAASLAAVALVVWVVLQGNADKTNDKMAATPQPNSAAMLASLPRYPFSSTFHEYLLAHQEFSPSTTMQGVAPYIRTVSDGGEEASR